MRSVKIILKVITMLWTIIAMITMVILAAKTWIETFIHLSNPALLKTELNTGTIYNTVTEYILFQSMIVIFYIVGILFTGFIINYQFKKLIN